MSAGSPPALRPRRAERPSRARVSTSAPSGSIRGPHPRPSRRRGGRTARRQTQTRLVGERARPVTDSATTRARSTSALSSSLSPSSAPRRCGRSRREAGSSACLTLVEVVVVEAEEGARRRARASARAVVSRPPGGRTKVTLCVRRAGLAGATPAARRSTASSKSARAPRPTSRTRREQLSPPPGLHAQHERGLRLAIELRRGGPVGRRADWSSRLAAAAFSRARGSSAKTQTAAACPARFGGISWRYGMAKLFGLVMGLAPAGGRRAKFGLIFSRGRVDQPSGSA